MNTETCQHNDNGSEIASHRSNDTEEQIVQTLASFEENIVTYMSTERATSQYER